MAITAPAPRVYEGENPFNVDPALDYLQPSRPEVDLWNESYYFHVWNPVERVGMLLHLGRVREDLELFYCQTVIMLPDGGVLADRTFGRPLDNLGPATGNLRVMLEEPLKRWRITYDGAGEYVPNPPETMARRSVGSGPALPCRFEAVFEAAAPVWDLQAAIAGGELEVAFTNRHHEQAFWTSGTLTVSGVEHSLKGVGFRDHSTGPRQYMGVGGNHFYHVLFPESGRLVHGLTNYNNVGQGEVDYRCVSIYENGRYEVMPDGSITGLQAIDGTPRELEIRARRTSGEEIAVHGEAIFGPFLLALYSPNVNLNGIPRDIEGLVADADDPLITCETPVRFTWIDGEVGFGHFERAYRERMLPAPDPR
jgi:hypothetical protein